MSKAPGIYSPVLFVGFTLQLCSSNSVAAAVNNNNSGHNMLSKRQFGTGGGSSFITFFYIFPVLLLIYLIYRFILGARNQNTPDTPAGLQYRNGDGVFVEVTGGSAVNPNSRNKTVHLTPEELSSYPIITLAEATADIKALSELNHPEPTPPPQLDKDKSATFDSTNGENFNFECSFCLQRISPADQIRLIPCLHLFHLKCLDSWLSEFSTSCPTCRFDLVGDQSEPS